MPPATAASSQTSGWRLRCARGRLGRRRELATGFVPCPPPEGSTFGGACIVVVGANATTGCPRCRLNRLSVLSDWQLHYQSLLAGLGKLDSRAFQPRQPTSSPPIANQQPQ